VARILAPAQPHAGAVKFGAAAFDPKLPLSTRDRAGPREGGSDDFAPCRVYCRLQIFGGAHWPLAVDASRRAKTEQDRRRQPTPRQGGPPGSTEGSSSQPVLIKDRISTAAAADAELHYRTGLKGRLARFFIWRRAAGDPYDETLVLPALIVIMVMRLNTLGRLDDWTVFATILATAALAGAWLGASLGPRGQFRAILRGISVGAIEAAGAALVYGSKLTVTANSISNLIIINLYLFWLAFMIIGSMQGVALLTEKEWQEGRARRASLRQTGGAKLASFHNFVRLTVGARDLKGQDLTGQRTTVVLMVRIVQAVFSLPVLAALLTFAEKFLGISGVGAFLHNLSALSHPM
jgi:hypothetical protein